MLASHGASKITHPPHGALGAVTFQDGRSHGGDAENRFRTRENRSVDLMCVGGEAEYVDLWFVFPCRSH